MNIFYLDKCPIKAAKYQYNKHVVKMILESAQMLCTAHHAIMGEDADVPYKRTHRHHPCTVWTMKSGQNYAWLYYHMMALGDEYSKRYGKKHLTITKCEDKLAKLPGGILETGFEQPPQAMPDKYKDECSIQAYWNYYIGDKHYIAHESEKIYKTRPNG